MRKILFVTYGGGHVNMLLPVIQRLQAEGFQLTVLALTTAGNVLKTAGIPHIGFKDLLTYSSDDARAISKGRELVGEESASQAVPYDESVAYHGLSYMDLEASYGVEAASEIYQEKGRQAFYPVHLLARFIGQLQPDLLIATNSPRAERAAIDAARLCDVAAMCLVDLFAKQEIKWIGQPGYANKICVISEQVKNAIIAAGRKPSEIAVTGNPIFDGLKQVKSRVEQRIRKQGQDDVVKLLWASQPEPEVHPFNGMAGQPDLPRQIDKALIAIAKRRPDWHLLVRPHPSENTCYGQLPNNVKVSEKSESLHDVLAQVDCVITMTSTVGFEAALVGQPLVTVDMSVFTEDAPYSEMGLSVGVSKIEDLEQAIEQSLAIGYQSKVEGYVEVGNATDQVIKEVKCLLDSKC